MYYVLCIMETKKAKNKGQIVVLVLLLSLMGLTIGLSQVSRSLSDLKQVTYVDAGTKAFAAAEAALQYGLNQLTTVGTANCTEIPIKDVLFSTANFNNVTYKVCPNPATYAYFPAVPSDEVREIDLTNIDSSVRNVNIAWFNAANAAVNANTGLEVVVVDNNFTITRYVYNAYNITPTPPTGFNTSYSVGSCLNCFPSEVMTNISNGSSTGSDVLGSIQVGNPANPPYILLRIKPLANSLGTTDIVVVGYNNGGAIKSLGPTTYTVTATATTTNNTTKKLQVIKISPALPGVFDFAIFSRGSVSKN